LQFPDPRRTILSTESRTESPLTKQTAMGIHSYA
jgi:hypothetical protein